MNILHRFPHGLGDAVQFTAVLRHLRQRQPADKHGVLALPGKTSAYAGLAEAHLLGEIVQPGSWDKVINHAWDECWESYPNSPGTKASYCLRNVFDVIPDWNLMAYQIKTGQDDEDRARTYQASLPQSRGMVVIHYEGNTSGSQKNLNHDTIKEVCTWLISEGFTPVILDWDHRSPLPDGGTIFCPDRKNPLWQNIGTGDAATLSALIQRASAVLAIDSGPQKVAFATNTPTVAVWTGNHPYHYCDRADNALHLLPDDHVGSLRGNREHALKFFIKHYKFTTYGRKRNPANSIKQALASMMGIPHNPMADSYLLRTKSYDRDYYEQHREAGLDYLGHGDWQIRYGKWVADSIGLVGKTLLDVGCAAGSIAAGIAKAGVYVSGVDCNEHMINLGRQRWLREQLKICDATNLHYWGDDTFDCVHTNNVFEHLKPELVPFILKEMMRVTKPGGVLFSVLDTTELYERQKRDMASEDATHVCVMPEAWWLDQAVACGWVPAPDVEDALRDHPDSFFERYDWPVLVYRKPAAN
jgi:2-polyprenyl-3-methyl-5-hydroxy-6-metoxy-1,4-benzoquinol methylase